MTGELCAVALADALAAARAKKASDVHLQAGAPPVLRIDGVLEPLPAPAFDAADMHRIVRVLFGQDDCELLEREGDRTVSRTDERAGALRIHAYRGQAAPHVAIRLLQAQIPSLQSLCLPDAVASLAGLANGLVLFAGATGSGKSTTMAAVVDSINATSSRRILTLEDPIEYRYANKRGLVAQRQIGEDVPDLASALRGALRSDPDVIVIGEVRDAEGIAGALTAAETGHLVTATIHTGDAVQTIDRIIDAFSGGAAAQARAQLAQSLAAIVCQQLVRRTDGPGRRALAEVLVATDAVRNMIRESKTHLVANAMATGRAHGMQTFEQARRLA